MKEDILINLASDVNALRQIVNDQVDAIMQKVADQLNSSGEVTLEDLASRVEELERKLR